MSHLTKKIGLFISTIVLLVGLALMLFSFVDAYLPPSFNFLKGLLGFESFFRSFLATALFWTAAVLAVLALVAMVVITFYPKTKKHYPLLKKDGHLHLYDTAVEGLVKSVLRSQGYMKHPKVKAKLYSKKIEIAVKGELQDARAVFERTESAKAEIAKVLQEFIGVKKRMRFAITVDHVKPTCFLAPEKQTSRVE